MKRNVSRALRFRDLVRHERAALRTLPMPLRRRAELWRQGYMAESGLLYDLGDRRHEYVSDFAYAVRTPLINGPSNPTLDDKVIFFHTMRSIGAPTPTVHGLSTERATAWFTPPPAHGGDPLLALLEREGELVLKPAGGGQGDHISFLAAAGDRLLVNGEPRTAANVSRLLTPGMLVSQRVRQGAWADRIFAGATNTLRLMTMWDLDRHEPFVAKAIHRFGTARSAPVDNFAKGGLSASVELETGELGEALMAPTLGALQRFTHHPGTGAAIAGTRIPGWSAVVARVLEINRRLAHIPYIGWDVLVGDEGWWIIEGNHYPSTQIQAFGPLLVDPRVRRFYEHHGVIAPRRTRATPHRPESGVVRSTFSRIGP